MRMLKKICNGILTIILTVLAIVAVVLIIPKTLGYEQYAVLSGSMEPVFSVGSLVFAKKAEFGREALESGKITVGDIITYQLADDTRVTHRIVSVDTETGTVRTKGDANTAEDAAAVRVENICAVYAFDVPYLGYLSIYGRTPLGIGIFCGILVLVILLQFLPEVCDRRVTKAC